MARKKKNSRKKSVVEVTEKSPFWAMAGGILMILLAIFTLLGGFGAGGPLPTGLFNIAHWAFGWGAYMVPVALVFFGIYKFTSEDNRIPLGKNISMLAFLVVFSAWLHVAFVSGDRIVGFSGGFGGNVGSFIGNLTLGALTKVPASIMLFVFAMLAFFFAFNISPDILLDLGKLYPKKKSDDKDLTSLKSDGGFKLNEGVPIEHKGRLRANFKSSVQKTIPEVTQEALTTTNDPNWKFPSLSLLNRSQDKADPGNVDERVDIIKRTLENFNISVGVEGANVGPRVTQYMLKPQGSVKLSKLSGYADNLAYALAAKTIRIEAPIPGKSAVGVEVPNVKSSTVRISSIFSSTEWIESNKPLTIAVGKDISGKPIIEDLEEMPHLLVAGQTKSGKSVMINSILTSFLYRNSPSELKLILVDPKRVELKPYDKIPHLLTPVITEPEKCVSALKWTVAEMERRLKALSEAGVRDISEYNEVKKDEGMPNIVLVIDELSDLMMVASKDVEALISRIAQKARAAGIHLILATQDPRAEVITGLIKANVPARMAFTVAAQINSQIIIGQTGAEKLLGRGDMLLSTQEHPKPIRVQGALIETEEVKKITEFLRAQREPLYDDDVASQPVQLGGRGNMVATNMDPTDEPIYQEAVKAVIEGGKASTSFLQMRLRIGFSKAARLMEIMEQNGIVGPSQGSKPREVLISSLDETYDDNSTPIEVIDSE